MASSAISLEASIAKMLQEQINKEAQKAFDDYKKEAVEKFADQIEDKRNELIAKMALKIFKGFEISRNGETITISVRKEF